MEHVYSSHAHKQEKVWDRKAERLQRCQISRTVGISWHGKLRHKHHIKRAKLQM